MKGDFHHILNRGVEEREIFYSEKDYFRFTHNLSDFNNVEHALPYSWRRSLGRRTSNDRDGEKKIVNLLFWCLMPNHIHLFSQDETDAGASVFSKKIFGGYTKYINELKKRKGVLFQGRSKIILIERDEHFFYLPFYIMANPVSLIEPGWREKGIVNLEKVINFIKHYRWSSFQDLIGRSNFPGTVDKNLFYELFDTNEKRFEKDFVEWLAGHRSNVSFGDFID